MSFMDLFRSFLKDERGQDFAEYSLLLGAIAAVAGAVILRYKNELKASFDAAIDQLQEARR